MSLRRTISLTLDEEELQAVINEQARRSLPSLAAALRSLAFGGVHRSASPRRDTEPDSPVLFAVDVPMPKTRARNPIWDCIAEQWFGGVVPESQTGRVGKLARDFKQMSATPEAIREKRTAMQAQWGWIVTPEAVVKHWGVFEDVYVSSLGNVWTMGGEFLRDAEGVTAAEYHRTRRPLPPLPAAHPRHTRATA